MSRSSVVCVGWINEGRRGFETSQVVATRRASPAVDRVVTVVGG